MADQNLLQSAQASYFERFNGDVWLGRCIFLSFYCSVNTCDFCFRSVADKRRQNPSKAKRSLGSIISEALLIRACDWRIEFLTGGYGILDPATMKRYVKLVSQVLNQKIWLNLGVIPAQQLKDLSPYVEGVVASLETLDPALHKKTCPDKPLGPYLRMLKQAKELGLKRSITLIIGLGEDQTHWPCVDEFLQKQQLERITLYALRPVKGTPYEKGPTPQEFSWWIAMIRTHHPDIEIIAGTAEYRLEEIPLLLKAGANALTKLPAVKIFNKELGKKVEELVVANGRRWVSKLSQSVPEKKFDAEKIIASLDLSDEEKQNVRTTYAAYLKTMTIPQSKHS